VCTKERTGAVAVRAAIESAVQVGRGDEGNRQAEMANPTKCRDSLQARSLLQTRDAFTRTFVPCRKIATFLFADMKAIVANLPIINFNYDMILILRNQFLANWYVARVPLIVSGGGDTKTECRLWF
jgi:hypothetical protein